MKEEFEAELVEGHKRVVVAIVPFDPETAFKQRPMRLSGRRHGWLVKGTINGVTFDGYVGERWGRFFVILEDDLRAEAKVAVGDRASIALAPTKARAVFDKAFEQSRRTTEPGKARADATPGPGGR